MTQAPTKLLDLSRCADEPIRTPGSIQPHGFMLTLSPELGVLQASANLAHWTGVPLEAAIGQPLAQSVGEAAAARIAAELGAGALPSRPTYIGTVTTGNGGHFDVLAHAWDGLVILEFEGVDRAEAADFRHLYPLIGDFLLNVNRSAAIPALSELAARRMRDVTGYGRVMVYQFDPDGHGRVLAESKEEGYESYLGQYFPASDVPAQARALYTLSPIRVIQDANYVPATLVPELNPATGARNDLSFAALRSVSPVHLQYMRNMGTLASMSVSIIVKGKLWGLISCHNAAPCPVSVEKRTACEQLGQILALCIESREDATELQFRLDVRRIMVEMLGRLTKGADFLDNMSAVFPELLRFARAGGVAIVVDDRVLAYGDTPDEPEIRALAGWLSLHGHTEIFHTDHLKDVYPAGAGLIRNASGLLALPISRIHQHYLLWFRPEVVQTIEWAGNPHAKDAAPGSPAQLTPRLSFQSWRETIHGRSLPWHSAEIELTVEFRTALLGIALERAEQMAELAEELGRANKELEAFSYSVSHDLRAPLRHIVGFSDLLIESAGAEDPQQRQRFLKNIKESARLAGKLVDDLLSFSQMGRAALRPARVDMNELVAGCIDKLGMEMHGRNVEWHIEPLPVVEADPTFLHLAVFNLLSNAVKFTGQRDPAVITISSEDGHGETVFHIADNGAGFNMDYVHKLFGVFQRLHRMEDFQGTGIGLANVRRIIERHNGRTWAHSVQGEGATFSFSLPKHPSP
ncbi:ATP-binding protein [Massilia yuzhufengensis]|uniref:histidine kinase n=1 Tax=Massilia yuzhufengensis TaxID=1164594 RepID=A0A1I1H6X4_9BURK|nr:ATP-binding protein [Massilia yuzhufengensis]SFC19465.1 Bacteriophytochrome (light-regulated signal transduction histidine kinase) [Massilia yuzhufengensis]